jgi:uncharacterized protein
MNLIKEEIDSIKEQIVTKYNPSKIILFGSQTKGTATRKSDIDICIIKDAEDKRKLLIDMYINIESNRPFDLLLYTEDEWKHCIDDSTSFAYLINKKGIKIYG